MKFRGRLSGDQRHRLRDMQTQVRQVCNRRRHEQITHAADHSLYAELTFITDAMIVLHERLWGALEEDLTRCS